MNWLGVQALEKIWGLSLSYPVRLAFFPEHTRLIITDRLLYAVFIVDMHCPAKVTLTAVGGEPGHTNGHAKRADLETQLVLR